MFQLFAALAVGLVSEFLIIHYYKCIQQGRTFAVVVFNILIMLTNVLFIGWVESKSAAILGIYFAGQSIGIVIAMRKGSE